MHIAARTGCKEMVESLITSNKADQAMVMKNGRDDTALHVAVKNGHLEVVKLHVDLVNNHKESPLYLAVERGFFKIAQFMMEKYSPFCSCEGTKGMTALHAAVIRTHKGQNLSICIKDCFDSC